MIFDRMERLGQYRGLNPNLDTLIDYVLTHDTDALAPGKNEVDGENCWISSNVAELSPTGAPAYERHLEYIDLQIPLEEGEIIRVRPVEDLTWPPLNAETVFAAGPEGTPLDLVPGVFAVFFPGDAHHCGFSKGGRERVRKLVGKARR